MDKVILKIEQIDVYYNGLQALKNVSLEVKKGEIVALVGSNGSGKSTLLKAVAGAVPPARGVIRFGERSIHRLTPYQIVELGIAYLPEGKAVFPELTVMENLVIGSFIRRARSRKKDNLERIFELFPRLRERKNQIAHTLSGGEQQMLVIGRALMSEPSMLLFDEISAGLAPLIITELYQAIQKIRTLTGTSILLIEQNTERSFKEAERIYFLETGRIVLSGSVEELRNRKEIRQVYFGVP